MPVHTTASPPQGLTVQPRRLHTSIQPQAPGGRPLLAASAVARRRSHYAGLSLVPPQKAVMASSSTGPQPKRITQATFDETVRENMEEFEMDRPEAVADAVKQFTSQGVDLSNVCITATAADEAWLAAHVQIPLEALTAALDHGARDTLPEPLDAPAVLTALQELTAAVSSDAAEGHEEGHEQHTHGDDAGGGGCCGGGGASSERAANAKKMVAARQGMNLLARLWAIEDGACDGKGREVLLAALTLARALLTPPSPTSGADSQEAELRDSLWPTGMGKLCGAGKARPQDLDVLLPFLAAVRLLAAKCEDNKVHFANAGGLALLITILEAHGADRRVVCGACGAMRAVTAVDDMRKDFSASHTHTRELRGKNAIPLLIGCARRFEGDLEVAVAAFAALRNLANNDDSVGQIAQEGGLEMAAAALGRHGDHAALARTVLSVFRNVSADDALKSQLCSPDAHGAAGQMLQAMQAHLADAKLQEHALATVAAMALRSPDNAGRLAALGCIPLVLQGMRGHPEARAVQRQGCLAVRNLASRAPALAEALLEAGAEPLLRQAGRFQESVDEAYAALRDLGCDVRRVVVDPSTGMAREAVEQFGQGGNSNFRACFETSNDVEGRVAAAAVAPAAGWEYRF